MLSMWSALKPYHHTVLAPCMARNWKVTVVLQGRTPMRHRLKWLSIYGLKIMGYDTK